MAKLVARLFAAGSSLGSIPDIPQKYKIGEIIKGVANRTQSTSPKKKTKKNVKLGSHVIIL
jgi:hypothetical protein